MSYLSEQFEAAVCVLVGEGSVKDRLVTAYAEYLNALQNSELPQNLQARFRDLHTALHAITPIGDEPPVRATVRKMSMRQAGDHARTIISLYAELIRRGERPKSLAIVGENRKKAARSRRA